MQMVSLLLFCLFVYLFLSVVVWWAACLSLHVRGFLLVFVSFQQPSHFLDKTHGSV